MAVDLLITIDTEADNEWDLTTPRAFENIQRLPDFQQVCDQYGARPTYLVAYDVVQDDRSRETLQQLARTGRCEIGAHLHAWSTPPEYSLVPGVFSQNPYLHEYPRTVQEQKLGHLTRALTAAFHSQPRSYRGGRWSLDAVAVKLLVEAGYLVDTTVTPGVSWRANPGYTTSGVGSCFAGAPQEPYFLDHKQMTRPGTSPLLEIPVSITARGALRAIASCPSPPAALGALSALARRVLHKAGLCKMVWLRPGYSSSSDMAWACDDLSARGVPFFNLMFHSSELIAGGSPRIPTEEAAQRFRDDLERVIGYATNDLGARGQTLTGLATAWLTTESATGVQG
ncbi:MAG: polysaccharide deacetylase family protein [Armatimonadota bacterium]